MDASETTVTTATQLISPGHGDVSVDNASPQV